MMISSITKFAPALAARLLTPPQEGAGKPWESKKSPFLLKSKTQLYCITNVMGTLSWHVKSTHDSIPGTPSTLDENETNGLSNLTAMLPALNRLAWQSAVRAWLTDARHRTGRPHSSPWRT
ncbi:g3418 [Coccomyxa elongata]